MTKRLSPDPEIEALVARLNRAAQTRKAGAAGEDADAGEDGSEKQAPPAARPPTRRGSRWPLPDPTPEAREALDALLDHARARDASDLLIVAGVPPVMRIHGELQPAQAPPLTDGRSAALCAALVPGERRERLESTGAVDFALPRHDGRVRCNVHRERGQWSAALRLLPRQALDLVALDLPAALGRFCELRHGLLLITGPTGAGKSTTLAALVRGILARRNVHLVTVEDPVEYEHDHAGSVVEHIEIGRDALEFDDVLRSVLRQNPDVILIGEMRDEESMRIAMTAAETGHLVLSTMHTGDAYQTVNRIVDSFPPNQTEAIRAQLGASLAGIVSQQLLPRADGSGRVPAVEIIVGTPAVRHLIRQGKSHLLRQQIELERQAGMLTLDDSLARLVARGLVRDETATARARAPEELDRRRGR